MTKNGRLEFKTICVTTDLSGAASSALRYAQAIARLQGAKLVIVHVIDPVGYAFPDGANAMVEADPAAREELRKIEDETRGQGIPVHSVVESGVVCERILQAVKDNHADLLVLGTRGKTEAGRLALGRVARRLLAHIPCPILAVSPDADAILPRAGNWQHVVAAIDFSPASISALHHAHRIALEHLVAVHAVPGEDELQCKRSREGLRFLAPLNESHTVPVDHIAAPSDAAELIVENARKFHADLVVLGSPVNELTEEDFSTSTVLQVISLVKCPVLCVPFSEDAVAMETRQEAVSAC